MFYELHKKIVDVLMMYKGEIIAKSRSKWHFGMKRGHFWDKWHLSREMNQ